MRQLEPENPYIQSIRLSFSLNVPGGIFNLRNANTRNAETPLIGRFMSECISSSPDKPTNIICDLQKSHLQLPLTAMPPPTKGPIAAATAHVLQVISIRAVLTLSFVYTYRPMSELYIARSLRGTRSDTMMLVRD